MRVASALFVKSATAPSQWPPGDVPEIAFVGRSNVGKSSMINRLANTKGLARVSNTPGRTRLLNFFDLTLERKATRQVVRFCDLPGYGFAKVSKDERARWAGMIETYLEKREALRTVVAIVDARHGPTEDDLQLIRWLDRARRRPLVVATKIDKLPKARRAMQLRTIEEQLALTRHGALGFSSVEGLGKDELWSRLLELCAEPVDGSAG